MKRTNRILLTVVLLVLACTNIFAYDCEVNGIYYNRISVDEFEVTSGTNKYTGDIVIPETVEYEGVTYNVTSIGNGTFFDCYNLISVVIGKNVTNIGNEAFYDCRLLTTIMIPGSVTSIGNGAFQFCRSLKSVTIPDKVTGIGDRVFYECDGLTSITIPSSVTSIGKWAFAGCDVLTSVTIPNGVSSIDNFAFNGCGSLTKVIIGNSIQTINENAFANCTELIEVQCNAVNVLLTATNVFEGSYVEKATLCVPGASIEVYKSTAPWTDFKEIVEVAAPSPVIVFADAEVKALCVANWDTDGDGELSEAEAAAVTKLGTVFKDNEKIKSFDELKYFTGLNKIDSEAFQGCTNLKSIELPAMVTGIGSGAFLNCKSLLSIEIPASVKTLGYQAFCNCTSLTSFTVPASVTYIGERIFVGCSSLASLKVEEGNAVYDSRNDCNAIIKTESDELLAASLNTVIPEGIKKIYDSVFSGRKDLIHVVLPEGLETLGNWVFSGCTNLQSLSFPSTMKDYGEYTISGVTTLRQLIINAREAPANRFRNFFWGVPDEFDIYQFTWYVPKGTRETYVKSIPWWSGKARGIIELGEDTEVITFADEEVQRLCIEKYDANYSGTVDMEEATGVLEVTNTYFSNKVFNGNTQIKSFDEFQYFIGIEKLDASAFSGCSSLASITLPENLTSIGTSAFGSCSSLTTICIPQNVTTIGSSAFIGCDNMKSVTMMNSTPITIGQYADPFPLRKMITLRVPKGCKAAYASADYWREFKDIVEIGDAGLAGDANGDGVVDVADVVAIVNYILNKPGENFNEKAADVNGDGVIDVADVVAVVNIILKGGN